MKAPAMFVLLAGFSALVVTAQQPTPSVDVPQGARVVLQAKGDGVQIYTCTETPTGVKWMLTRPDAKLLDASGRVIGAHFAGPTWRLNDGGQVQGQNPRELPNPHDGSIAWLLIDAKPGTATGSLATVANITRTETHGGLAPASGCQSAQDVAKTVQVPYTAAYTFYAAK